MIISQNNCPICGKAGLPDFRKEEVVCPACNTNLKVYLLLRQTTDTPKGNNIMRMISFIITGILFIICIFFFIEKSEMINNLQIQYNKDVILLNDSIILLKSKLEKTELPTEKISNYFFVYTIKEGDSFCLISRKFYGTEKYARTIAENNNMEITSKLIIGEKLMIQQQE
ncbi:LysM peptidoglycan-binding domain-containing protein [Bacteroidales bacterium OttesenSCG-928-B11]|nr:LysM peptidoglycan-binding domain-containing protein [Bacteroidales bacterium OttesenSCG-928-B11]